MPPQISKKFSIFAESGHSSRLVSDMIRRFRERTQTCELIVKFNITVEKTDESTISMAGITPGEVVDQKERRRYIRKEMAEYNEVNMFEASKANMANNEKELFDKALDVVTKANMMLNALA